MRLTDWINPLPNADPSVTDRLVALRCAVQLTADSVLASGAADAGKITTLARRFEDWIRKAADDDDRLVRRAALVMTCDKAGPDTNAGRLLGLVKELHHYVTR